jgi:hypothetical protein
MSTQGEFGALATINVKAYASYSILEEKIRALLPSGREKPKVPATAEHAGQPLHLVMKTPPSLVPEKCPIEVRAVVIGSKPITQVRLGYRKPGQKNFQFAPMSVAFRKTYGGAIPAEAVSREGIEFFVEARDSAGGLVCAPRGFPITTYSASVVPWPKPAVYLTQCRALPRMGKNYRVLANVIDRPPSPKVELF